ncbi:MAG: hypothetical protein IPH12_13775 [Saprospirales bacterium]|nr:hypothetical protein [Saprospirales bacterium]MBK8922804.1 hypothetical protein [Saprospirales bacterium]
MYKLFSTAKKMLPAFFLGLLLPAFGHTQTNDPVFDRFEQLLRRMDGQMRRGMPFDTAFSNGRMQFSPDSSSFFYFHIDTSFNGAGSDFFHLSPFGSPNGQGLFNLDQLFEQFFNGADSFAPQRGSGDFPADDGQKPAGEDDLLPEERLRLREELPQGQRKPAPKPEKTPQSKVKTIRI